MYYYFRDLANYYVSEVIPSGAQTRKLTIRTRDRVFRVADYEEFIGVEFDEPISSIWQDTFITDVYPYDILKINPEEWYDIILYDIYEKINVMFFQVISFEEYFLFFTIYLVFAMIINGVISEVT